MIQMIQPMLPSKLTFPRQNAVSAQDVVELMLRIAEDAPPNNDTNDPDNLTDTGASLPRPSRVTVAFIVLTLGFCLLSISYLIYHPPTRLIDGHIRPYISRISNHLPKFIVTTSERLAVIFNRMRARLPSTSRAVALLPTTFRPTKSRRRRGGLFRVGEGRLVQWAQEDMGLVDMDSEADFMVNAEDSAEAAELDLADEYIPLSVGMGWKGRPGTRPIRNYGSAKS